MIAPLKTVLLCSVLAFGASCNVFDPPTNHKVDSDEVVIQYDQGRISGCWMARKGDRVPSAGFGESVAVYRVRNGNWDDALRRLGLDEKSCAAVDLPSKR